MIIRMMRRVNARDESGMALVSVIAIGSILAMLAIAGVAYSVNGQVKARTDQDGAAALAAAYAGIEEYQSRLANSAAYVRFGNSASDYTSYVNPANPSDLSTVSGVKMPVIDNPAFGVGESGPWATVAHSAGTPSEDVAQYRYEVNNSKYDSEGKVTLRSTGRAGTSTRSIVADLKQNGFVNYVYFTDLETQDPNKVDSPCYKYAWDSRPSSCGTITFAEGDILDGSVHSNDTMVICNSQFLKKITTESPVISGGRRYVNGSGCDSKRFSDGPPAFSEHVPMPASNADMKKETRYDLIDTDVPNPGCLYTGPTSIVFKSDGTMVVKSPWTKFTQTAGSPTTAGRNLVVASKSFCGTPAALASSAGATVAIPNNNLIFVQDVPASRSGAQDPNYTARSAAPSSVKCDGYYTGPSRNPVWNRPNNGLGYPVEGENYAAENPPALKAYDCQKGDVFIEGTLKGKVTVASENYMYVVNDLKYTDPVNPKDDILGLVGQASVIVWNPTTTSGGCLAAYCDSKANGRTIEAAILSVQHTFTVQNYSVIGDRGYLNVRGSIAQKFRGIVAQGDGYSKNYKYDTRFTSTAPPKFLAPANTTYGVTTWVEINPVFDADGSYR